MQTFLKSVTALVAAICLLTSWTSAASAITAFNPAPQSNETAAKAEQARLVCYRHGRCYRSYYYPRYYGYRYYGYPGLGFRLF